MEISETFSSGGKKNQVTSALTVQKYVEILNPKPNNII